MPSIGPLCRRAFSLHLFFLPALNFIVKSRSRELTFSRSLLLFWTRRRFASGKGSALVLDVGEELTSVVPIYDGFVLRKGLSLTSPLDSPPPTHPSPPPRPATAVQKQPAAGALLSDVVLSTLKSQTGSAPVNPHYLVKSKEAVDASTPAKAILRCVARHLLVLRCPAHHSWRMGPNRKERLPNAEDPRCPTTPSYHRAQEQRVMHEFKETVCEVYNAPWDDACVLSLPHFSLPCGSPSYFLRQ